VLGPFYVENPPEFPQGFDISRHLRGEKLFVQASVCSAAGGPLANALIEVWQSDTDGFYDMQRADLNEPARAVSRRLARSPLFLVDSSQRLSHTQ
jgi:protocatechuate 3,4-dioxygenase beta subunit